MGDHMIDDASEIIEQRSRVASPARMMVRNGKIVASRSNELARESQGRRKNRGTVAEGAKPAAAEQDLHLNGNWNATSLRSSHQRDLSGQLTNPVVAES